MSRQESTKSQIKPTFQEAQSLTLTGFSNRIECHNLPVSCTKIIPETLTGFLGDQMGIFQPGEGILARVSPTYIQDPLILGLRLALVMTVYSFVPILGGHSTQLFRNWVQG
jgi:hypothetical protein